MAILIGVSGLCGSGKTTSIRFLSSRCPGEIVYLGGMVLLELERRKLDRTPENELKIQNEIREEHGSVALAVLAAPIVSRHLDNALNVIVDAIFSPDEFSFLRSRFPGCKAVT